MPMTSMKLSTETRDRVRALAADPDDTLEDVVNEALDALESQRFWARAEAAAARRAAAPPAERAAWEARNAEIDAWMDRL
jgi:hypothetical protein